MTLHGLGGALRIERASAALCNICQAAQACAPVIATGAHEIIENARSHLLVALVVGLRRESILLCDGCKGKLEALATHLRRGVS